MGEPTPLEAKLPATEVILSKDLERWKQGAEQFGKYWTETQGIRGSSYPPSDIGVIQAMFLGEKPAGYKLRLASDTREELEKRGFRFAGDYVYRPDIVSSVCKQFSDEFAKYGLTDPEQTMQALQNADEQSLDTIKGLVLGFPASAVEDFSRVSSFEINKVARQLYDLLGNSPSERDFLELNFYTEKRFGNQNLAAFLIQQFDRYAGELNLKGQDQQKLLEELSFLSSGKNINIYGVAWTDYRMLTDSVTKQERLKTAFEQSGILCNIHN